MRSYFGTAISKNLARTPEGFLICRNVIVARTATRVPQLYRASELSDSGSSEKKVPVWRMPEDVFSAATIASLEGKPVCSPHPPSFLSPQNIMAYQKGTAMNVRPGPVIDQEQTLMADLVITDARLIDEIISGRLREVSVGYDCIYLPEDSGDGFVQRNITANHLAIVPAGRAGPAARIYDHDGQQPTSEELAQYRDRHTPKPTISGVLRQFGQVLARYAARGPEDEQFCINLLNDLAVDGLARVNISTMDAASDRAAEYARLCGKFHRRSL